MLCPSLHPHTLLLPLLPFVLCGDGARPNRTFTGPEKYPNEIVDLPVVLCEQDRIVIKIKTTAANPSHIYVEDFADDPDCFSRNMNKLSVPHGKCGMISERSEQPTGTVQRLCISVQLHPLFVTEADRSYCAQCVYMGSNVVDDLQQELAISEASHTELDPAFDSHAMPRCTYSIRKIHAKGPEAHYASVGERVWHVWSCDKENTGILVQNCYVEDGHGNKILIIDQNGCGVDAYVMQTPQYSNDLTSAVQETHVFKFAQKTVTRFTCQIRLCLKEQCRGITPPVSCPTLEERLEAAGAQRDQPSVPAIKEIFNDFSAVLDVEKKARKRIDALSYEKRRGRRATKSEWRDEETSSFRPFFSTRNGYPEMDVVGELRVLDSEDDIDFYEERIRSAQPSPICSTSLFYVVLVSSLVVVSILLITLVLLLMSRNAEIRSKRSALQPSNQ